MDSTLNFRPILHDNDEYMKILVWPVLIDVLRYSILNKFNVYETTHWNTGAYTHRLF